jgi:hypothetical protein
MFAAQLITVRQGKRIMRAEVIHDQERGYVLYQAITNAEVIRLNPVQQ